MTRSKSKALRKAGRLYRQRQYAHVINLLEPQVFMYRESWTYYHILGMSCMYTGDYAGAYSYLRRAADLDDEKTETMLAIGAVLLRRRQVDLAIRNYLDILDGDPRNRRARKALQWIRTLENPDDVIEWFESGKVKRILPRKGAYLPRVANVGLILIALAALAVFVIPPGVQFLMDRFGGTDRPGSEILILDRGTDLVVPVGQSSGAPDDPVFVFTEGEVENLFRDIGRLFNDSRDNMVRRELNRIQLSNAGIRIKQQAELLRAYLVEPDFTSLSDSFSYRDVEAQPALYNGVYVKWRGRIANLVIGEDAITFDLLVGYESGRVVDGIVPVRVPYAVLLNDGESIEVIGRVIPRDTHAPQPGPAGPITVIGTSIRTLAPGEIQRR
ncbi:MAG: hypothetical protein WCY01_10430 [Alkalispirochaeta sp.]